MSTGAKKKKKKNRRGHVFGNNENRRLIVTLIGRGKRATFESIKSREFRDALAEKNPRDRLEQNIHPNVVYINYIIIFSYYAQCR